jgi:uncharacterized membrane protein
MVSPRIVALLYALFASLAVLLCSTTMPPMQNADEAAHAFRADQISRLRFAGAMLPDGEYGGDISSGLKTLEHETAGLPFHSTSKVTRGMYVPLGWGAAAHTGFPNTAVNPPFFYLPAAAMAALARQNGISLPHALVLMRLASGLASVAIAAAAIALAGDAAIWLFAVLLLPMSMALTAAVSQDGPMLACTALATAFFLYTHHTQHARQALGFAAMCLLLTLVGMARAPYLAFALLALAAPVKPAWRVIGASFIFLCVICWSAFSAAHLPLPTRPDGIVSPVAQLLGLAIHPWRMAPLAIHTWRANDELIARSFIGQLGWLDVELPAIYRHIAWVGLGLAALAALRPGRPASGPKVLALKAVAVLGAAGGVALIQYMTWTALGSPVIEGIQGRYFLAPALVLGVFMGRPTPSVTRLSHWLAVPVLIFPIVSIAVVIHALIIRYYF